MDKPLLHVVSFSGGKDSTAMLIRMLEEGMPIDLIVFCIPALNSLLYMIISNWSRKTSADQ